MGRSVPALQEEVLLLRGEHARLGGRLREEQERKRSLEEAVVRERSRVEVLEDRVRRQEEHSTGASREVEERTERLRAEEVRIGQLGAEAQRLHISLQVSRHNGLDTLSHCTVLASTWLFWEAIP